MYILYEHLFGQSGAGTREDRGKVQENVYDMHRA